MRCALVVVLFVYPLAACGGGSKPPQSPSPSPVPTPQPWSVTGRVVTTLTGVPVAGAHVDAFIAAADSDSDGRFTLTAPAAPAGNQAITVTADGYRPRETVIRLPRTADLVIDITSTKPPFDETFYNQLARDALETPGADYPLYRWSEALKFYVQTKDETGRPLSNEVLAVIRRSIRDGVRYYTNGVFDVAIEEGAETRAERVGWVNVVPRQVIPEGDYCGFASSVGGNPMTIQLRLDYYGCGSLKIPAYLVMHEVGHAVGMFNVAGPGHIMNRQLDFHCRDVMPTALERHHAAIIYSRPRMNRSPDRDPGGFALGGPGGRAGAPGRP